MNKKFFFSLLFLLLETPINFPFVLSLFFSIHNKLKRVRQNELEFNFLYCTKKYTRLTEIESSKQNKQTNKKQTQRYL